MGENSCGPTQEAMLYAGQNNLVGKVTVEVIGSDYKITYMVDPGYCITETHLEVGASADDFHLNGGGNPQNGQFTYGDDPLDCVSSVYYMVPVSEGSFIAAHAVVNCVEEYLPELPETADFCITAQGINGSGTYFDIAVGPENTLTGDYSAWCVDVNLGIAADACVDGALVYSSMDFPEELFDYSENMPAVIWLLNNQQLIGQTNENTECGQNPDYVPGPYNFGDYQNAIWLLLNGKGTQTGQNLGDYDASLCRAGELEEMALKAIEDGWIPKCGDYVGVILVPVDENMVQNLQPIILPVSLECNVVCSETAWARNSASQDCGNFPGGNWSTYFEYGAIPE